MHPTNSYRNERISKFLSRHLRHSPERLGLSLEPGGWVRVEQLLHACETHPFALSRSELEEVVATNDKQRFSFDPSRERIRANQGHSVEVDLQLEPRMPPAILFHGTGHQAVPAIELQGLQRMRRHHVHLSTDYRCAQAVGRRHGRPVVYEVDAAAMARAGFRFFQADNGVWLTDAVPTHYLRRAMNPNRAARDALVQSYAAYGRETEPPLRDHTSSRGEPWLRGRAST